MDTFLKILNKNKENNVEIICQNLGIIHSKILNETKTVHTNTLLHLIEMNIAMLRYENTPVEFDQHYLDFCEAAHVEYSKITEQINKLNIDDIYKLKIMSPWCFDEKNDIINEEIHENYDRKAGLSKKQIKMGYIKCPPGTKGEGRIRKRDECNKKVNKKLSKALKRSAKTNVSKRKLAAKKASRTRSRLAGRRRN